MPAAINNESSMCPHPVQGAQRDAWLRLAHTPGLSHAMRGAFAQAVALQVDRLFEPSSLRDVLKLIEEAACEPVDTAEIGRWISRASRFDIDADREWLEAPLHHLVTLVDEAYPPLLKAIADPPLVLYVNGDPKALRTPQIAVIGSRAATRTGLDNAARFAGEFVKAGLTVTSGLARGIDGCAHRGAIDANGQTVALMATGPDRLYPSRHAALARHIVASGGALVTEFACGSAPRKFHFARRNRLISGLSLATVVVEGAVKSGSMITARLAAEQGRDVFAVPGPAGVMQYEGCHALIRDGAILLDDPTQIFVDLGWFSSANSALATQTQKLKSTSANPDQPDRSLTNTAPIELANGHRRRNFESGLDPLTTSETADRHSDARTSGFVEKSRTKSRVVEHIGFTPTSIDELVKASGLTAREVCAIVTTLEVEGCVHSTPGGGIVRAVSPGDAHPSYQ